MKKQVTFAESQTVHRLHHDVDSTRRIGMNDLKKAVNVNCDFKNLQTPATACEPQLQDVATIQIPRTMTAGPFLKHTALTPAQKEYLYTIAASYSATHVRNLITQHYMNVLHRCVCAGYSAKRDDPISPSPVNSLRTDIINKHQPAAQCQDEHKMKKKTSAGNAGKSLHPKVPSRQSRRTNTSASKQTVKERRPTTSATRRRKSPKRGEMKPVQKQEEVKQEEEKEDFLSQCLSWLSVGEWDDDTHSDL